MNKASSVQAELKNLIGKGLDQAIKRFEEFINPTSPYFNNLVQVKARYSAYLSAIISGTATLPELNQTYAQLCQALIMVVDALQESDFKPDADQSGPPGAPRRGELLYYIPKQMQEQHEYRCTIRVAYIKALLYENWKTHVNDVQKSIRVAEVMSVELLNIDETQPFNIRTLNDKVQFLDEYEATDWLFFVRPRQTGEFPLALRISVIEIHNGREIKKDVVLEQHVIVATEAPLVEEQMQFSQSGIEMSFATAITAKQKEDKVKKKRPLDSSNRSLRVMAILLVCLLLTSSAGWAFTPPATRDWCIAYYLKDKAEGYTEYVKKYPDSPYREKAVYRKAVKTEQPQDYRDYLKEYGQNPNAQFKVEAQDALRTMETKQMEVIKKHPYVGDIRKFIHDFPDSKYLKELLLMIESNPVLKTLLLTEIEQALKQAENPPAPSVVTQVSNYSDPAYQGARETREHPNLAPKGSLTTAASDMNAPQAANLSSAIVNNDQIQSPAVNYPITPGMVFVSGGTFQMGGNEYYDEKHIHQVTLSGFEIGKYEVTQTEWVAIMGSNPSRFAGCGNCPVENIAWNDIQQFLKKLNEKYPGKNYRLPTEAEWEYAARGGAQGAMNNLMTMYAGSESLDQIAWYSGNSGDRTHPVGQKKPNLLGLYDMCGNVYEWCNDWFGDYSVKAQNNPNGPKSGSFRVQRGGAWDVKPEDCRVANRRHRSGTIFRRDNYGFRLARTPNY